jgi:2-C-methyl-D-erythritol 4-phosphate cytidylyltransferase
MAGSLKKEFVFFEGKPVLARALHYFIESPRISDIVITLPKGLIEEAKKILKDFITFERLLFIEGGITRQESVFYGLLKLVDQKPDFVLIHDGARPWITPKTIELVMDKTIDFGACIPVTDATDALKEIADDGFIKKHLDRTRIKGAQTPQGFIFTNILKAHEIARKNGHSAPDDADLYDLYCGRVYTVPGDPENRKITYKHDIH